jgi:iron(III) transport system ATP-binding protein
MMNDPATVTDGKPARWGRRGTAGATIAGLLTFDRVSRRFKEAAAVSDVSFDLKPGEIACLLGPSGCGKTTLLRIAAGVDRPTSGRVLLDGEEIAGPNRFVPPERRNIGLMFQDFALFPHLSIIDNVAFGLNNLGRTDALKVAGHALERVGLAEYGAAYPHKLSGGEQQRVALARALVPRPQVMLMDEPFSGLDQRLRESVRAETLALLRETRASCLLVTHDPVEAMGLADRILLMRQGRLIQAGSPEDLYKHPVDIDTARFFSDANEIAALVRRGEVSTPLGSFKAPANLPDQPVLVMLRPQGIGVSGNDVGIEGYVLESRFEGDDARCSVLFKGLDDPLLARISARTAPQKGTTALFDVDPAHVLIFPRAMTDTI